jgi:Glucose / Sorbosone dehydrogenase
MSTRRSDLRGMKKHRELAIVLSASALGFVLAGSSCSSPASAPSPAGGSGNSVSGSGAGGGGSSAAGAAHVGGGEGGKLNNGGTPASGGTPAGGGGAASGGGASGSSGAAGASGGGAGGTTPVLTACATEPAATAPALKKTAVVRLPNSDQAGEVIAVPGEPGFYILGHRTGKVYYAVNNKLDATPMATVAVKNNPGQDEQGLLGMALHPDFATNHLFYLLYTAPNANIHIEELERTSVTSSKPTGKVVWDNARAAGGEFHNGGQIRFNPKDGGKPLLYHSVGNNANVGQSGMADGIAGRVLIHDLAGADGNGATLAYGLRNPYRMAIDRVTGDMFIGETDDPPGGAVYYSPFTNPVKDYGYRGNNIKPGITGMEGDKAMIGGIVYRGNKIAGLCGRYFYSTWPGGAIKSIVVKDGKLVGSATTHNGLGIANLDSFGEDGVGEMYISTQDGEVYRIEAQ